MDTNKEYEKKSRKILKTYNSILVKCKNIPVLSEKNIVIVDNMDSMVNAQIETRKPILYFQETQSISFILLDGTEAYIHILKANKNITTQTEQMISDFEIAKNTFVKEILSKIEKVLLNGSIGKENLLTSNELKYIENIKQEDLQDKDKNIKKSIKEIETKETNNLRNDNSSNNLYLIPIKKNKFKIFNKGKKSKKSKRKKRKEKKNRMRKKETKEQDY